MDPLQIELWSRTGTRIADITHLCQSIFYSEERNEAETLTFSVNLDAFERYLINEAGVDVVSNFREGQTEIKVKEFGQYRFGTQLYYAPIYLNRDGSVTMTIQAVGYLNFFKDRYPDPTITYGDTESVDIFYGLVEQAQAVTNGDYGIITKPTGYYATGVLRDRTYEQYTSSTKLNMQRLTNLETGNFDFRFLHDKNLMTYQPNGSVRTDFKVEFDRTNFRSTLDSAELHRGANNLFNRIIGIGSGFGEDAIFSFQGDTDSQVEFGLRELPVVFNEVSRQSTLDENAIARLARVKDLLRMPQLTLSGADLPMQRIEISDIFPVRMTGLKLLEDLTGMYRVERKEVKYDAQLFIKEATFYFEKTGEYV